MRTVGALALFEIPQDWATGDGGGTTYIDK